MIQNIIITTWQIVAKLQDMAVKLVLWLIKANSWLFEAISKLLGRQVMALVFSTYIVLTGVAIHVIHNYMIAPKDAWATTKTVTKVAWLTRDYWVD